MDEQRFDAITRQWAVRLSRREAVRAGVVTTAALLSPYLGERVALACGQVEAECTEDRECCDGARCEQGNCRCRDGLDNCDGRCRDLKQDRDHCGRCNNRCSNNERCDKGRCQDPQQGERSRCLTPCYRNCAGLDQTCYNRCLFITCRNL